MESPTSRLRRRIAARQDQLALFVETAEELTGAGILGADALTHIRAAAAERRATIEQGKGFRFVQIDADRMNRVLAALHALPGARTIEAMRVLLAACDAVGWDDQWCTKTQQELASALNMDAGNISRAFQALMHESVRALVAKERHGHSWRYEIDAQLASRLSNAARTAAAARQSRAAGTTLSVVKDKGAA